MWAAAILAKMLPKGKLFGHKIAFFLRADNQLYQTVNSGLISLEYFDTFQGAEEHVEPFECLPANDFGSTSINALGAS